MPFIPEEEFEDNFVPEDHFIPEDTKGILREQITTAEQEASKGTFRRFVPEFGKGLLKTAFETPAKFSYSAILSPVDIIRGTLGKRPIAAELPFAGKTFQAEAQQRMETGEEMPFLGKSTPLKETARAAVEVPLAGLTTLGIIQLAGGGLRLTKNFLQARHQAKNLETTIEAISPDLKGAKLTKEIVGRAKAGQEIFGENSRTLKIAAEFRDLGLDPKNPVKNVSILQKELVTTGSKLDDLLAADKAIFPKKELQSGLELLKTKKPREFIGDTGKLYDDVVDFAKEIVEEEPATAEGIRNARIAFDFQAKVQYSNAYKGGYIDTKSSSGRAIKSVRDHLNNFLYEKMPSGSEAKILVDREAKTFQALDNIAPKAVTFYKTGFLGRFLKKHKLIKTALPYIAGGGALGTGLSLFKKE